MDFYTGVLGLRLVKKTVNFDDPTAYHLYYGDTTGSPGSLITFFYWPDHAARGRVGAGHSTAIVFSAPADSLDFWQQRLAARGITAQRQTRFDEEVLRFSDPDGIPLELVAVAEDPRSGWDGALLPPEFALRGLHTAELTVHEADATERLITGPMGYHLVKRAGNRARYAVGPGGSGHFVDLISDPAAHVGMSGTGTIHHIAWSVPDDAAELALRHRLQAASHTVSGVRDRDYFRSIYYREPSGILFEIATATPGFTVDEAAATLGTELRVPKQFTAYRAEIERRLPPLRTVAAATALDT